MKTMTMVLPEHLFVNLIDVDLQRWIAQADKVDANTGEILKVLLGMGPTTL